MFCRFKQRQRTNHLCKNPTEIDVANQQNRGIGMEGHAHVGDVTLLDVDLDRTARPFNPHDVELATEMIQSFGDHVPQLWAAGLVGICCGC